MLAKSSLEKLNLKFAYYVFNQKSIDPIIFSNDEDFRKEKYYDVLLALMDFFSYINALNIYLTIEKQNPVDVIQALFSLVVKDELNPEFLASYDIEELDLSNMDIQTEDIPKRLDLTAFKYVRLFLMLQTGAALNKTAIEYYIGEKLSDSQMQTIKKIFEEEICCRIIKRDDNSYFMEVLNDEED